MDRGCFLLEKLIVNGKRTLEGEVKIHGAKNAVLPILCASILCDEKVVLHNCPVLSDVENTIEILNFLGCNAKMEGSDIEIEPSKDIKHFIPEDYMNKMRSSIIFLGSMIARNGCAKVCMPGGCELGPRPIDIHLNSFRKLGIDVHEKFGVIECKAKRVTGTAINLPFPSVGATENVMLAAVKAKGRTIIHNAAREPEIKELEVFLNKCGADVSGAGGNSIVINGVDKLCGCEHSILPDRIEASTYMSFAAVTGGNIIINDICTEHIEPVLFAFRESGCDVELLENSIKLTAPNKLNRIHHIKTLVYPGFPTDSVMPLMAMCVVANGTSVFEETIFQNRFKSADELNKLGAKIDVYDRLAIVEGVDNLYGAEVKATDLRGGAALICAGLCSEGKTVITELSHIDRGYEKIELNLNLLGADIKRS